MKKIFIIALSLTCLASQDNKLTFNDLLHAKRKPYSELINLQNYNFISQHNSNLKDNLGKEASQLRGPLSFLQDSKDFKLTDSDARKFAFNYQEISRWYGDISPLVQAPLSKQERASEINYGSPQEKLTESAATWRMVMDTDYYSTLFLVLKNALHTTENKLSHWSKVCKIAATCSGLFGLARFLDKTADASWISLYCAGFTASVTIGCFAYHKYNKLLNTQDILQERQRRTLWTADYYYRETLKALK